MMKTVTILATACALAAFSPDAWAIDGDGDGHDSIETGGDDCDDYNANRFPGNPEICDTVDNDCNPNSVGFRDADEDGYVDKACCNFSYYSFRYTGGFWVPVPVYNCGDDCDDNNLQLIPMSQRCEAGGTGRVQLCQGTTSPGGNPWSTQSCGSGMSCAAQPNGTGVCR